MRFVPAMRRVLGPSLAFGALAFLWSLIGLLGPSVAPYSVEYTSGLLTEVAGHVAFGVLAGLATMVPELSLVCGAEAILIDTDHILAAFGLPVYSRLAHSAPFVAVACLLPLFFKKGGRGKELSLVTCAAFLSHLAFDVLMGDSYFPLADPLSFTFYPLPALSWVPLESAAVLVCLVVAARRAMNSGISATERLISTE